jgi:hypothetical protein
MPLPGRTDIGRVFVVWAAICAVAGSGCAQFPAGSSSAAFVGTDNDAGAKTDAPVTVTPVGNDASACSPGDVGAFQPDPYHPATAAWQNVCTPAQIGGFYDACLGQNATKAICDAFTSDPTATRCAGCILTSDDLTHYGPLIDHMETFITTNVAGCIELTDPQGLVCARAIQALAACELLACQANCPVEDTATRASYDACAAQADQTGCKTYTTLVTACVAAERDGGLVASCLIPTFADFYAAVVPLFCGPPEVDASVPPFDASAGFDAASPPFDASSDAPDGRPPPPFGDAGQGGAPMGSHDAAPE